MSAGGVIRVPFLRFWRPLDSLVSLGIVALLPLVYTRFMIRTAGAPSARPTPSRVLAETRTRSRSAFDRLDPGGRMEAAFVLSMDARKLMIAGSRARGFSEVQIRALLSAKKR